MRFKIIRILYLSTARIISLLPWSLLNLFAIIFSRFWYYIVPVRRNLIIANLTHAFPEKSQAEIKRITLSNLKHYVLLVLENLQCRYCSPENYVNKIAAIRNPLPIKHAINNKTGVLFLSAHMGNFEMLGPIGYFFGFPKTRIIVKPLRNPAAESLIQEIRGRWVDVILSKNGLSAAVKAIRNNRMVGVMLDQHAGSRNSVWVDFFGREAGTMKLLAILADRTSAPVIPAHSYRLKDGRFVVNFDPPLLYERIGSNEENIKHNTAIYTKQIEKWVRLHPEQWFWIHRRWKKRDRSISPAKREVSKCSEQSSSSYSSSSHHVPESPLNPTSYPHQNLKTE